MAKLCPFKRTITTREVNSFETVRDEEFCLCDEERCMAYFLGEYPKCILMKKNR